MHCLWQAALMKQFDKNFHLHFLPNSFVRRKSCIFSHAEITQMISAQKTTHKLRQVEEKKSLFPSFFFLIPATG